MVKKITYGKDARLALLKGIDTVADAVKATIGPKGRNVILHNGQGIPQIINDGVSIARDIVMEGEIENAGAQLMKSVSAKANDIAGDGSSTSTVLAQAIIHKGMKQVDKGHNPVEIRKGIEKAVKIVTQEIKNIARPVETIETIAQVATVSAGNNEEVGDLIAKAMEKVGKDGIITLGESMDTETKLKVTEGMQLESGYIHKYFIKDTEQAKTVLEDAHVLCINRKMNSSRELIPILEYMLSQTEVKPFLIIADEIEGELLDTLATNVRLKKFDCVAIKAPYFGDLKRDILEDVAKLTGGIMYSDDSGVALSNITPNYLGTAKKITVTSTTTTIVADKNEELVNHIKTLRNLSNNVQDENMRKRLQGRLAKLEGAVAIIEVGATTDVEAREKKLRIEDALNATKSAVAEGIVAGGGTALAKISLKLKQQINKERNVTKGVKAGMLIIAEALTSLVYQIAENAGKNGNKIIKKVQKLPLNEGYDALSDKFVDMVEAGIIDPAKVERTALENAASIASMLLTTEVAVVDKKEN